MSLDLFLRDAALVGYNGQVVPYSNIVLIQKRVRGMLIRKRIGLFLIGYTSAIKIQAVWKGFRARRTYKSELKIKRLERLVGEQSCQIRWLIQMVNEIRTGNGSLITLPCLFDG